MGLVALAAIGGLFLLGFAIYGAIQKFHQFKEDEYNKELRKKLEADKVALDTWAYNKARELESRSIHLEQMETAFKIGIIAGRKWLAKFIAEADAAHDESRANFLKYKQRPARKAANDLAAALKERRAYKERVKFLEYQLLSYEEYFPQLEEYRDAILDEALNLRGDHDNLEVLETADPVLKFVDKSDYERLTPAERNQLALDRYLQKEHSQAVIGRFYERYLGYLYEQDGWDVEYHGIYKGFEDLGRDLICSKGEEVLIVQAKCWAAQKQIREKHVFQLFGTTQLYLMNQKGQDMFGARVRPFFVTSTVLSEVAKKAAEWLKIGVHENLSLDKAYPMIKCNVNQTTREKIYHLPFDQQYDRTKIIAKLGERYVKGAAEAEALGFRRAFRHKGHFKN